jgi:hypothetical protein
MSTDFRSAAHERETGGRAALLGLCRLARPQLRARGAGGVDRPAAVPDDRVVVEGPAGEAWNPITSYVRG